MNPNFDDSKLPVIACRPPFQQEHCWNGARLATCSNCNVRFGEASSNMPCPNVVIIRRRMTLAQCEVMRKKARKMIQDVKKYIKRKGL
jgi:hypothetical protein